MIKKAKQNKADDKEVNIESVNQRLDALIRIMLEIHFDKKNKFNLTAAAKALKSCGLGPKEIGDILGKKSTDVAPLLYTKDKKKSKKKRQDIDQPEGNENVNG